jgi:hypothetical protein
MQAFHYEIGTYFRQTITPKQELLFSAVIQPSQKYKTTYNEILYTASNIESPATFDTLINNVKVGKVLADLNFKIGINYTIKLPNWQRNTRQLHPSMNVLLSYSNYGGIQPEFENLTAWPLVDYSSVNFGIQFNPELNLAENLTNLKTLEKWSYRIGAFSQSLPYWKNDRIYNERGMTFGLGIPILAQQSLSSVNIAFQFGQRGLNETGALKESYMGINFGLILSPSSFDKWFRKRKLD